MSLEPLQNGLNHLMVMLATVWVATVHGIAPPQTPLQSPLVSSDTYLANQISVEEITTDYPQIEVPAIIPEVTSVETSFVDPISTQSILVVQTNQPVVLATPAPTALPKPAPILTIKPTSTPTAKPTPKVAPTTVPATPSAKLEDEKASEETQITLNFPEPKVLPKQKSLSADSLFVLINKYRATKELPAFEQDDRLCKLAQYRGPQLYDEIFVTHSVHQGLYNLKLPYWITENMASYPSEQQVFNWWLGSKIHRKAIESDAKYSCAVCVGNSCAQLFTSFVPKKVI